MTVEVRRFQMHPKLLLDVVQRQAGTLSKAILEGVMNAADAKATKVSVTVQPNKVVIEDDGTGFASREQITTFFEVFGQPHTESEGKTYGTFRMGRGQMFAFGANQWRTGNWSMNVDIQTRGLDYQLHEEPEATKGCRIEISLYKTLLPSDLLQTKRDLELWTKYAPIEVSYDGKVVSIDPKTETWDKETDEAYIRLNGKGSVSVYNLGIHVMEVPAYRHGTGGVAVSKKQVKVNFARNDIQSDCPVWKPIGKTLQELAGVKTKTAPSMTEDVRQHLADQIQSGALRGREMWDAKVITSVHGRHYTVQTFLNEKTYTVCERGDRTAERAMEAKIAFAVAKVTLERLGVSKPEDLAKTLKDAGSFYSKPTYVPLAVATKAFSGKNHVLEAKKLTPKLRAWLALANAMEYRFIWGVAGYPKTSKRELMIGHSESADGWTDGTQYIAMNDDFLNSLQWNVAGFTKLALLLAHEYSHHNDNNAGCSHEHEFFEEFHDRCREAVPDAISHALGNCVSIMEKEKLKVSTQALREQDRSQLAAQAEKKVEVIMTSATKVASQ